MQQIDFEYLDKKIVKTYNECLEILKELKEEQRGENDKQQ